MMRVSGKAALLASIVVGAAAPAWAQSAADIINATDAAAIEAQLEGDFGTMARVPSLPLGAIQEAWSAAAADAGTYFVDWSPSKVIRLRVREKMPLTITLPEWEDIGPIVNGDPFVFSYTQIGRNKVVVEAAHVGADATLTIVGKLSGRVYAFYLRAESVDSKKIPDIVVYVKAAPPSGSVVQASWPPAGDQASAAVDAAAVAAVAANPVGAAGPAASAGTGLHDPDYLEEIPFDPTKLQFGFTMSGDKTIAPERVFSDGVFTYFDWGDRWNATDLPAVYRVIDGVDTPQNVRYRGSMIVVESTGAFTLRNGQRHVCVRPEGWEPTEAPTPEPASAPAEVVERPSRTVWN